MTLTAAFTPLAGTRAYASETSSEEAALTELPQTQEILPEQAQMDELPVTSAESAPETVMPETAAPETVMPETAPPETTVMIETQPVEITPPSSQTLATAETESIADTAAVESSATQETGTEQQYTEGTSTEFADQTVIPESSAAEPEFSEISTSELLTEEVLATEESSEAFSEEMSDELLEDESTEEESIEEESTEEESSMEDIPEDDIEMILSSPILMDLGDVESILEITGCYISGGRVVVEGKTNVPFTTYNSKLYLFEEEMYQTDITTKPVADIKEIDDFRFEISFSSQDMLYKKYFVGVRFRSGMYYALSNPMYITNPEALATNNSAYPASYSKKGLFVEAADGFFGADVDELNISHATVNVPIDSMLSGGGISYSYNGKIYSFNSEFISQMDRQIAALTNNNVNVYAILIARPGSGDFEFPGLSSSVGSYHGWNVVTERGIDCVSAVLHFLAERYGRSDNAYGHIANWIVSNEVNAETEWNYMGHPSVSQYAMYYSNMMRITYQAVKSVCSHARIYMPLDMFWNNSTSTTRYDGKQMINLVSAYLKAEGDIAWGVAFHPYSNPLQEPEWWNDNAEFSENAGFISMQNISVLTDYMQKSDLRDPDGQVKKIICSEEGYTSYSNNQGAVEWKSAAAYAYAYYVVEANPYIQAITVMRQKDANVEQAGGLHNGMWYDNSLKTYCTFAKKPVWTVWKYIDTSSSFEYTDSLAPLAGLSSFSSIYGSTMAKYNRTVDYKDGGYSGAFSGSTSLGGSWNAEHYVNSISSISGGVSVKPYQNEAFTWTGISWKGSASFDAQPIFGFTFEGTAGANQNLRVRIRFTSGRNILESDVSVKKNVTQNINVDLSSWAGRGSVEKIQIWVQQDGSGQWENPSFKAYNFCKASGTSVQASPKVSITATNSSSTATGFDVYCTTDNSSSLSRVEFAAWHTQEGTVKVVTKNGAISGNNASAHFNISELGGQTGAYEVRIIAYDTDGIASTEKVVTVTVKGKAQSLVITNGYASNITSDGFTITYEARSDYGLSSASRVAVWSGENGQDDLIWYPLSFANGRATVNIRTANHKGSGEYYAHGYVTDNGGTTKLFGITLTVPSAEPSFKSADVSNVSALGYDVSCSFSAPRGASRVTMLTWNDSEGKSKALASDAQLTGTAASLYIKTSDHGGRAGTYHTLITIYDGAGKTATRTVDVKVPEDTDKSKLVPKITSVKTSDVTSAGYRVTVNFTSPISIKEVYMPTWTDNNGQDDIIWHRAEVGNNSATFYVKISDHKNESGVYTTHVYVIDKNGSQAIEAVSVTVPKRSDFLSIDSAVASEISSSGYRVTVRFTAESGVKEVLMPTWTAKNGQDDLIWYTAAISGSTATFYVSSSEHKNESGNYITHIYVRDKAGKEVIRGLEVNVPTANNGKLEITSAAVSDISSSGYRVTARFNAPAGVKEVLMPTWTSRNGQDDIVWHKAAISANTATFYVSIADHAYESGEYITHVYVIDKTGKQVLTGLTADVPSGSLGMLAITSADVSEVSSSGYRVTAKLSAPSGIREVLMPTWTTHNGQDDLVWHVASVNGNTATFYVSTAAHKNENGEYITHIYLKDETGKQVLKGLTVNVPAATSTPSISKITVSEESTSGYRVTAVFSAPAGVKQVLMPSWSVKNGQDDVVWHAANVSGNTATCYIPKSSHKNDSGQYITHVYVYDNNGKYGIEGTTATVK